LILLSLNRSVNKAALVSIPRDTRVIFKGRTTKINMINQFEGPEATCQEVGHLLDTPINHYIVTNFSGFEEIIDSLGGVYMDVDIRMHSYRANVYLEKGPQWLSGKEALAYVRFRSNPDMDIGRTRRQQDLLRALARQFAQKENIMRLPQLIPRCRECVTTNISLKEMFYIANTAINFEEDDIIAQTLPGYHYFAPVTGASFWEVDPDIAVSLLDSLFEGHRYEVIQPAPPWVNSW
ncbi:MAG: LCP family protein, partial [Deltaproteobacteria bacterium]